MAPQPEYIDDVFNCPPAYNAVFACISPADIIRAGRTCRLFHDAVTHFQGLAYNINRHLEHFVDDPVALRRLQAKGRFLISGSNALQFLDRTFYSTSDLDIFAFPESAKELGRHLIEKEGYVFEAGPKQVKEFAKVALNGRDLSTRHRVSHPGDFVYNSGMSDLLKFKNPQRDLEVQIISCRRAPLDCILYFHSTCVMNFITHDAAYSLYPRATFDKRIALAFGFSTHEATKRAYEKYTQRGWSFLKNLGYHEVQMLQSALATDITRYLDDKYTWRIPLDITGLDLDRPATALDTTTLTNSFHCNSWKLGRNFNGYSSEITLGISYEVYDPREFDQTYLIAERGLGEAVEQLIDYLYNHNPSRLDGKTSLDCFLPALRDAHNQTPKRVYSSEP